MIDGQELMKLIEETASSFGPMANEKASLDGDLCRTSGTANNTVDWPTVKTSEKLGMPNIRSDKPASKTPSGTSWKIAKESGSSTGCGLMGSLTMDDIEELKDQVEEAMTVWSRLAGLNTKKKGDPHMTIKDLQSENDKFKAEIEQLKNSNALMNDMILNLNRAKAEVKE